MRDSCPTLPNIRTNSECLDSRLTLKGKNGVSVRKRTAPLIFFASNKIRNCNIRLRHTSVARCRKTARHFARIISNDVLMVCAHVAADPSLVPLSSVNWTQRIGQGLQYLVNN
jgi:hypothetical protein